MMRVKTTKPKNKFICQRPKTSRVVDNAHNVDDLLVDEEKEEVVAHEVAEQI